jgi:transcriptional regulator with AAA-type ATPase domain
MNDTSFVGELNRLGNAVEDPGTAFELQFALASEPSGQIFPAQQFHGQEGLPLELSIIEHLHDVRTTELRRGLRLALETLQRRRRGSACRNHLQRNVHVELDVVRPPERAHPASSDLLDDLVALAEPISGSHHFADEPYHAHQGNLRRARLVPARVPYSNMPASSSQETAALRMPDAMPIRTVAVEVTDGADRGQRWLGEQGTLGTAKDNALVMTDETVSRYHLRVTAVADGIRVSDLGSTNGTFLGDVRLEECVVPDGTTLRLGRTSVKIGAGLPATVELHDEDHLGNLRGSTQAMRRLMSQVRRAAQSNVAVLFVGESGTGKELLARAVHDTSPRASAPFVTIDCGAVTPTLVASELFGHEKGAFTGASHTKVGAFEDANGGTIFLDEVGELAPELQVTLLGALERRRFCRVGGRKELAVDVRIVAATNRDLRADVNAGVFRLDLYYRLAVVALEVPSLRERIRDIPLLAEHFAREAGFTRPMLELFPEETMQRLLRYRWPGNVRELRNYVQATIAMGEPAELRDDMARSENDALRRGLSPLLDLTYGEARSRAIGAFERQYLERLLERTHGNVAQAAREAGMARSHLNELLRRHKTRE